MASFSKKVKTKYGVSTYEETKNTYDWILKAIGEREFSNLSVEARFLFHLSSIVVSCESIEEFCENAYGYEGYSLISAGISSYSDKKRIAHFIIDYDGMISISTESKVVLEKIESLLIQTSLDETEINNPISIMYVQNNDGVIVNGGNNLVSNNHSSISITQETSSEPRLKQWFKSIMQNLLANGIWYILALLVGVVATYLVKK